MGWRDHFTDQGGEPEDRTFTFTGFSTPQFEQALADMRRHFGDDDPDGNDEDFSLDGCVWTNDHHGDEEVCEHGNDPVTCRTCQHLTNLREERLSHLGEPGWETTTNAYRAWGKEV